MKRRLKSLFRISMGLMTLGTVMLIVGLLLGGAGELSKEIKDLVHVVRVGVTQTVERVPMLETITNYSGFTLVVDVNKDDEVSLDINEQYETFSGNCKDLSVADVSEVKNLDISVLTGTVTILPSESGQYGFESFNAEEFQCYVAQDTLYLSAFPKKIGKADQDAEIVLYVPADAMLDKVLVFGSGQQLIVDAPLEGNTLNISAICGTNRFTKDLIFHDVTATVGIGSFYMERLVCDNLKLEVSTADAEIKYVETTDIEASLGMGNLKMEGCTTGDVSLNCGMGHLDMILEGTQEAYNYDISGSAESVQIGSDVLSGMVMERWIDNGAEKKITLSCAMGSVEIEFYE